MTPNGHYRHAIEQADGLFEFELRPAPHPTLVIFIYQRKCLTITPPPVQIGGLGLHRVLKLVI